MKINKGMSVLLASMLVGSMLVGCSHNNTDTNKAITKSVKATEDKKEDAPPKDNKESSSKNIPESVKKKSKAKETITVESYKCKYCGDTIYYIIEDKEYGINGNICWGCYWNRIMEAINEPIEDDVDTEDNVEVDDSNIEEDDVETEADNNEDYDDEDYDDGELDEEYYEYENSDDDYDYDTEDDYDTEEYDDDYDDEPIQEDDTYEIENYNEEDDE